MPTKRPAPKTIRHRAILQQPSPMDNPKPGLLPPEEFPIQSLGPIVEPYVKELAAGYSVPPSALGLAALVTAAGAAGRDAKSVRTTGPAVLGNLLAVMAGRPGSNLPAALQRIAAPLDYIQGGLIQAHNAGDLDTLTAEATRLKMQRRECARVDYPREGEG